MATLNNGVLRASVLVEHNYVLESWWYSRTPWGQKLLRLRPFQTSMYLFIYAFICIPCSILYSKLVNANKCFPEFYDPLKHYHNGQGYCGDSQLYSQLVRSRGDSRGLVTGVSGEERDQSCETKPLIGVQ